MGSGSCLPSLLLSVPVVGSIVPVMLTSGCAGCGWSLELAVESVVCVAWCGCGRCVVAAGGFAASLRAFGGLELPMAPLSGKPGVSHVAAARANLVASVRCGCKATVVMLSSLHRYRSW